MSDHPCILVFGIGIADEHFDTVQDLARRVHELRAGRSISTRAAAFDRCDGQPARPAVSIRLNGPRRELVAYALTPFNRLRQKIVDQALLDTCGVVAA